MMLLIHYQIHKYKMVDEMNRMNDFVEVNLLVMEIIYEYLLIRSHLFANDHRWLLYLLVLHMMTMIHRHIDHHQQDPQEVFQIKISSFKIL